MDNENLKSLLIRDKQFLRSLYESKSVPNTKHILNTSDDAHLNTLIKYLHFITKGDILINIDNKYFKVDKKSTEIRKKQIDNKMKDMWEE